MIRARSRWNSVRYEWLRSEYFRPRESPDFCANGASTARSLVSISSGVLEQAVSRSARRSEECLVTIDSQSYLSIFTFEISNLIWARELVIKKPPKDGFAVVNQSRPNG